MLPLRPPFVARQVRSARGSTLGKCRVGYHPAEQHKFRSRVSVRDARHKTIMCAPHTDHQSCGGHTTANIRRKALRLSYEFYDADGSGAGAAVGVC